LCPWFTALLAILAGAIHLAHNYLPMSAPPSGSASRPATAMAGGPSGLMSLIGPHLTEAMILNFVGFVGLAAVLVFVTRRRPTLRVLVNVLLACMSAATLYAWNAMGRANPESTGTMALIVESALIVLALGDAAYTAAQSRTAKAVLRAQ
jgi:hypothetical protein